VEALSGEVGEELLAGAVLLLHDHIDGTAKRPVEEAELAVLVAVGVLLFVFEPQEQQGHPLAAQFFVHRGEVRLRALLGRRRGGREQPRLQGVVVVAGAQRRRHTGPFSPPPVVRDRAASDAQRGADLAAAQAFTQGQTENFPDLAHGETGSGPSLLRPKCPREAAEPPHLTPAPAVSSGCPKTPEWVSGMDRNGCPDSSGIRIAPACRPRVFTIMASTLSSVTVRAAPQGSSNRPTRHFATNRQSHLPTVASSTRSSAATARLGHSSHRPVRIRAQSQRLRAVAPPDQAFENLAFRVAQHFESSSLWHRRLPSLLTTMKPRRAR
jgi:hypothetical protein